MKKNYQAPAIRAMQLGSPSLLTALSSLPKGDSEKKADVSQGAEAWSKQFWGLADDDQDEDNTLGEY